MGVLQLSQLYVGHNILTPYEIAWFEIQQQKNNLTYIVAVLTDL